MLVNRKPRVKASATYTGKLQFSILICLIIPSILEKTKRTSFSIFVALKICGKMFTFIIYYYKLLSVIP